MKGASPLTSVAAFAPATVANLGPGFDVLGMAVDGAGDTVVATLSHVPGVSIAGITGTDRLSTDPTQNTAGIAAAATLELAGIQAGVSLQIHKGLPLCSGLGSSAAPVAWGSGAPVASEAPISLTVKSPRI